MRYELTRGFWPRIREIRFGLCTQYTLYSKLSIVIYILFTLSYEVLESGSWLDNLSPGYRVMLSSVVSLSDVYGVEDWLYLNRTNFRI